MTKPPARLGLTHQVAACATLLALACTGELTGPGSSGATPPGGAGSSTAGQPSMPGPSVADDNGLFPNPPAFQPAAGLLRRLTRSQFRNAIRDVFGVDV